jgi:hypothetical protein
MTKCKPGQYHIISENDKFGLAFDQELIYQTIYDSIELISDDLPSPPYSQWEAYENDPEIDELFEWYLRVVKIDGKFGIIDQNRILSELKFERVIKLTFMHFLCKENGVWTLYGYHGWLFPISVIPDLGEVTLSFLIHELSEKFPYEWKDLSRYIFKDPKSRKYISEYRRYTGSEFIGSYETHSFRFSSDWVLLHDDFSETYLRTDS